MAINPEIRDQAYQFFIEEAPELLQVLEAGLLTLEAERSTAKIHNLMRAAHSLKGGAASVELEAIATLAHRLENILKALYNESLEIDTDLETRLLQAYDCLRVPLTEQIAAGYFDSEQALAVADLIFAQIEERLGDALTAADSYIPSSADLGVNMALSIFEVDVAEGLERLANVAAHPQDYQIAGELRATSEVFSGFAELLNQPGFGAIAQTVRRALDVHPKRALEITQLALADFQLAREAILAGKSPQEVGPSAALMALADTPENCLSTTSFPSPNTNPKSPSQALLTELIEDLGTTVPLLEDVFSGAFAISQLDLGDRLTAAAEQDEELDETFTIFLEDVASYNSVTTCQANTDVSTFPQIIDAELVAETISITEEAAQEIPSLEEIFGSFVVTPETEVSVSSSIVHVTSTPNSLQHQHLYEVEPKETPQTLEAAVQSIEQIFESLPPIQDFPLLTSKLETAEVNQSAKRNRSTSNQSNQESATSHQDKAPATANLTVRVDSERLERMNNLVGELAINRSGISLQNKQLQGAGRELLNRFARFRNIVKHLRELSDRMLVGASSSGSIASRPGFLSVVSSQWSVEKTKLGGETTDNGPQARRLGPPTDKSDFDSLELDIYGTLHSRLQELLEEMVQLEEAVDDITLFSKQSDQKLEQQRQMLTQLRDELMWARMLPVGEVLNRFPRVLRDLSTTYHKPVNLKLSGTGVLVDKAILEKLYDPLLHLLRNAFDHGIESPNIRRQRQKPEQGQIEIRAYHKASQTFIEVIDDGEGLNLERIGRRALEMGLLSVEQLSRTDDARLLEFIFEPGFSTANQVSELSGRGVGLDVVRSQLQSLKGTVTVSSSPQKGTIFTLRLPLTLTIAKLLVCLVNSTAMALPSDSIEEIVVPKSSQIKLLGAQRFLHWREQMIPAYRLADFLNYSCPLPETTPSQLLVTVPPPEYWEKPMLVLMRGQQFFALEVDSLVTEQELVIKPFGAALKPPSYTYGCTILGDGSLIPVIDGTLLLDSVLGQTTAITTLPTGSELQRAITTWSPQNLSGDAPTANNHLPTGNTTAAIIIAQAPTILVVDDSAVLRRSLALSLEKSGFRVLQARDGREAIEQLQQSLSVQLVISDIEMPNMNGFDFLSHRRQDPKLLKIPVVMLSSRSNDKHQWLAMHLGATAFFTKPYIEQGFLKAIKDILKS